ncbi:MAG: sigma-70 family RNA polymerase sigma factor [Lentisphaerae bacterium]|nr:MAG: sigma-70 family RNA polymerase sigma factor [Lentisphaerota bacterium]
MPESVQSLPAELTAQQREHFIRLWIQIQPALMGFIHGLVRDYHQAEDIMQNVAIKMMEKFRDFDTTRPFLPWAIGFAKNEILMQRRKFQRHPLLFCDDLIDMLGESYIEIAEEESEHNIALRQCLEKLHGRNRQLVILRYWQHLKPMEIAKRLGLKSGAVRIALMRIRQILQRCIYRTLQEQIEFQRG